MTMHLLHEILYYIKKLGKPLKGLGIVAEKYTIEEARREAEKWLEIEGIWGVAITKHKGRLALWVQGRPEALKKIPDEFMGFKVVKVVAYEPPKLFPEAKIPRLPIFIECPRCGSKVLKEYFSRHREVCPQ